MIAEQAQDLFTQKLCNHGVNDEDEARAIARALHRQRTKTEGGEEVLHGHLAQQQQ